MKNINTKIPHTVNNPCVVCSGHQSMQQGIGKRCWGFRSDYWVYCTREDMAYGCPQTDGGFYKHHLSGTCICGYKHWYDLNSSENSSWIMEDSGFNYNSASTERKRKHFQKICDASKPIKNTVAEIYLKKRGITIASEELRFHPALRHASTSELHPAMIAFNRLYATQEIIGIQRTYLSATGEKLEHTQGYKISNKMALGTIKGGAVWLKPPTEELGIAEGVETALSIVQVLNIPVCASLGEGFMYQIKLPPLPLAKTIKIFCDGDYPSYRSAVRAAEHWTNEGRKVVYSAAPDGKDFNDLLKEETK